MVGFAGFGIGQMDLLILTTLLSTVLFFLGVRILLVFSLWAIIFAVSEPLYPIINVPTVAFESLNSFPWVAIPIFVIVGAMINQFGISTDIIRFTRSIGGWLPGTNGITAILTSGIFSAITGSNAATTASVGEALHEDLENEGYKPSFAAATVASGGTLGIIIPPSVLFILYGVTYNVSVPDLFLAGIIPGLAMMFALVVICMYKAYTNGYGMGDYVFDAERILGAVWGAKHAFATITILLGGVFAGWFTPSESASAAFSYVVFTGLVAGRITSRKQFIESFQTGVGILGIIVPVYMFSVIIQQSLSFIGLQGVVANAVTNLGATWAIMLAMVVIMLISGSVLDSIPNMILVAPLLAPAAIDTLGLTPIMWGVVFMMSDAIGFITPPYGLNLFVISSITGIDYVHIARQAIPYLLALIGIWLFFFLFPEANIIAPGSGWSYQA